MSLAPTAERHNWLIFNVSGSKNPPLCDATLAHLQDDLIADV
jgi:hypothetical protein